MINPKNQSDFLGFIYLFSLRQNIYESKSDH